MSTASRSAGFRGIALRTAAWLPSANEIKVVTIALLGAAFLLQAGAIFWSSPAGLFLGRELGRDFVAFYAAGRILNEYPAARLYDTQLQQRIRIEAIPGADRTKFLPYLYPPFVAEAFRPLARMPYRWAFATWLVVSAGLYILGLMLIRAGCPLVEHSRTAVLLAMSFSPFLFETWGGGQLSAVGFAALAATIYHERGGRPAAAGLCAGILCYKPTLIAVLVLMFAIARLWRVLMGVAAVGFCLVAASFLVAGPDCLAAYRETGAQYWHMISQSPGALPQHKFVDLRAFLTLLLGGGSFLGGAIYIVFCAAVLVLLSRTWMRYRNLDRQGQALCWAGTLPAILLVSVYAPVYDVTIVVLSGFLLASVVYRDSPELAPPFELMVFVMYAVAIISQPIATVLHVQVLTAALTAFAGFAFWMLRRSRTA